MALGSTGPVETKVSTATIAAAASAFVVWLLRTYVFHGVVPPEVEAFASVAVIGVCTFAAGWLARHTPRTDPDTAGRHARPESKFMEAPDDGDHHTW